jgi:toxin ParE1/3/4
VTVLFLPGAEQDLHDVRRRMLKKIGAQAWQDTLARLRGTFDSLRAFPLSGSVPEELADLGSERNLQLVSSKNRVIYEPTATVVHIHIVCVVRRDLRGLLGRRLLSVVR